MARGETPAPDLRTRHRGEILGLLVVTFSLVILVSKVMRPAGDVFSYFRDLIGIVDIFIGAGIYLVSLFLWYLGVEIFRGRKVLDTNGEYIGGLISFLTALALIWQVGGDAGSIGEMIGTSLHRVFGPSGALFFLVFFLLVGVSMLFRVLLATLLLQAASVMGQGLLHLGRFLWLMVKTVGRGLAAPYRIWQKRRLAGSPDILVASDEPPSRRKKKATVNVYEEDYIASEPVVVTGNEVDEPVLEDEKSADSLPEIDEKPARPARRSKAARAKDASSSEWSAVPRDDLLDPFENYEIPSVDMLPRYEPETVTTEEELREKADKIIRTLRSFNVEAAISQITHGPSVTRYELIPASGVHVKKIVSLVDDLALNLATSNIRMEAPIPGKSAVGIEVPNENPTTVYFGDLVRNKDFTKKKHPLIIALGKTITGQPVYADLAVMPHLLIAGTTGSGKSVCMNTVIASILFRATPKEVRFIMVDPKKVELTAYDDIPHLLHPVVVDPKKAQAALMWAVMEMERRYELLSRFSTRNIGGFNRIIKDRQLELDKIINSDAPLPDDLADIPEELPYIVVIIDELADLMMTSGSDKVEECICRLAQMSRAVGIHLVVATQRPSVNVITGLIKANMPSRIAFMVSSITDSRTILDMKGAESLLGRGDMLYHPVGAPKPVRVQGAFIKDEEVYAITGHIKRRYLARYADDVASVIEGTPDIDPDEPLDPMIEDAIRLVVSNKSGSTSMLQRVLKVGHNRAMALMNQMETLGVVGPFEDKKPRKVLWTSEDVEARVGSLVR